MTEIKTFFCKFCKDGIGRTRKGIREHLSTHLRNEYFGEKDRKDDKTKLMRVEVR
jgi:hypothetical protein